MASTGAAVGCGDRAAEPLEAPALPEGYDPGFPDGVICGDPRPDGTVIWTRLAPSPGDAAIDLVWEVAEDRRFERLVAGGLAQSAPSADQTVKLSVEGLQPDRWYSYRFRAGAVHSPIGRLRTAPAPGSSPTHLRFAWASCQQRTDSFYVAHRAITEENVDFLIHLGDYVYVSDDHDLTLADYHRRYREFRTNPALRDLHAQVPLVAMWDDGEFYNGIDRTGDPARLAAATRAWFDAMPHFGGNETTDPEHAYRALGWGTLLDLFMIDVRLYRDPPIEEQDSRTLEGRRMFDPARTTLGTAQKSWLLDGLAGSRSRWRFLGNPYDWAPWRLTDLDEPWPRPAGTQPNAGIYTPNEAWDDYAAERREILDFLTLRGIDNVVSVSGHTHFFIASKMQSDYDDPAAPTAAFDFTCGSLTADPDPIRDLAPIPPADARRLLRAAESALLGANRYQSYVNLIDQGYGIVDLTPEEAVIDFRLIDTFDEAARPRTGVRFRVRAGSGELETERLEID